MAFATSTGTMGVFVSVPDCVSMSRPHFFGMAVFDSVATASGREPDSGARAGDSQSGQGPMLSVTRASGPYSVR